MEIQIYNQSLLSYIAKSGEILYDDLRSQYLPPEQYGVVLASTVSFDDDLQTLINYGLVIKNGDLIKYNERNR